MWRVAILAFLAGVVGVQQAERLPDLWWWPLPPAGLALAWLVGQHPRRMVRLAARGMVLVVAAALGVLWAGWRAETRLADELPAAWEGRDVEIVAAIAGLAQPVERGLRVEVEVESVLTAGARVPSKISLSWYQESRKGQAPRPPPDLVPGERWRLTARLRRPHGTQNPHGFDFEAWALERGIRATGYVRTQEAFVRLPGRTRSPWHAVDRVRLAVRERMLAALTGDPHAGVLVALAIGQQGAIPPAQWEVFTRTGTGHLMSISGLHITMVASLAAWLAFVAWARLPRFAARLPAQRVAALAGAFTALAYALVAGFSVPTQRTFFMLAVVAALLWRGQAGSPSRVLAAALLAVLVWDPWAVLAPGFWLSFGAVAVLVQATAGRTGHDGRVAAAVRAQAAVTLGLLPLTLFLFQEVSLLSPLANAIAIPLVSFVVVPLTLAGAAASLAGLGDLPLQAAHLAMSACAAILAWLAAAPAAVWESHAPPAWAGVLAVAGMAFVMLPRGMPASLRACGAVLMLPLFLVSPARPAPGEATIDVLDVGQGLAVVVRTASHALVYDTGPGWNPDADSGNRIVVPYLRGEGLKRLDLLVVSHDDADHTGGARSVIAARAPAAVLTSLEPGRDVLAGAAPVRRCERGQRWTWDGVEFEVLHPGGEDYAAAGARTNDLSCVLSVRGGGTRVLLSGDIEKKAEQQLLARDAAALRADIMVAPHHGSRTSSTEAFLDAVAPSVVVFAVGYRNRFRHPHPLVVARYAARGVAVYRTDLDGMVRFDLGRGVAVTRFRDVRRRYWLEAPVAGGGE